MPKKPKSNSAVNSGREINRSSSQPVVYPFAAIVGQDEMKLALLLSVIDPHIGGVIIMGHRGTGKSTAVRALADLLPAIKKVKACVFGCDPDRGNELCQDCVRRVAHEARVATERAAV